MVFHDFSSSYFILLGRACACACAPLHAPFSPRQYLHYWKIRWCCWKMWMPEVKCSMNKHRANINRKMEWTAKVFQQCGLADGTVDMQCNRIAMLHSLIIRIFCHRTLNIQLFQLRFDSIRFDLFMFGFWFWFRFCFGCRTLSNSMRFNIHCRNKRNVKIQIENAVTPNLVT